MDTTPIYSRETMGQMEQYLATARGDANKWAQRAQESQSKLLKLQDRYFGLAAAFALSFWANVLLVLLLVARR
jgi:hypothetical protein